MCSFSMLLLICVCINICEPILRIFRRYGFVCMFPVDAFMCAAFFLSVWLFFTRRIFGCVAKKMLAYLSEAGFVLIRSVHFFYALFVLLVEFRVWLSNILGPCTGADGLSCASHFEMIRSEPIYTYESFAPIAVNRMVFCHRWNRTARAMC